MRGRSCALFWASTGIPVVLLRLRSLSSSDSNSTTSHKSHCYVLMISLPTWLLPAIKSDFWHFCVHCAGLLRYELWREKRPRRWRRRESQTDKTIWSLLLDCWQCWMFTICLSGRTRERGEVQDLRKSSWENILTWVHIERIFRVRFSHSTRANFNFGEYFRRRLHCTLQILPQSDEKCHQL